MKDYDYRLEPDETWTDATPQDIPEFTYWPIIVACGLTFVCWGIITLFPVFILGMILFIVGVIGWIIDLRETFYEAFYEEDGEENGSSINES